MPWRELPRMATCLLAVGLWAAPSGAGAPYSGRRLVDVLADLQRDGLVLVFSSAVVTEDMVVLREPQSGALRDVLDEILQPHGLIAREAAGGALAIVPRSDTGGEPSRTGTIRGVVAVRGAPELAAGVAVTVEDTVAAATTSDDGSFTLRAVPAGIHSIAARSPLVTSRRLEGIRVGPGDTVVVRFELTPLSVFLDEVVVTPSHFRILEERPESRQYLTRGEVEQMPHAADDLYRAVKRLPGAAGGDYSARFNVRGGVEDETLVLLDGARLYEPFHLKDFQSVFSIIDSETVAGVDLLTGGFPAEYGDRMSGVMDISVARPPGPAVTTVAVGTLNSRVLSAGLFDRERGSWLVSARAWYPGSTAELVTGSSDVIRTHYFDLFGRVEHSLGSHSVLTGDLLAAYDDLGYLTADEEETEEAAAEYASYQLWSNLETAWTARLFSETVLAVGRLTRDRRGGVDDVAEGTLAIDDDRAFDSIELRQGWSWAVSPRHLLKWGFEVSAQEAVYDYRRRELEPDGDGDPPVVAAVKPEGTAYGVYLADRFQPAAPVVVEVGLRWDDQSWVDGPKISPRVSLMLDAGARTTLRAAWGRYTQSQRLNELQVEDGVTEFFPTQRSEHWLASVEHEFSDGVLARAEIYQKDFPSLGPRYENLFSSLDLFPEALDDRVLIAPERGRARGVELYARGRVGRRAAWWASYVASSAEDLIEGSWQPRSWDQRHAVGLGLNLELPARWNLNLAGLYHSGWPATEATAILVEDDDGELVPELVPGPRNAARLPSYHRIDVRATKDLSTRWGELRLVLEVLNLFNSDNVCCIEDFEFVVNDDGTIEAVPQPQYWAPVIPSVGLQFQF